MYTGIAVLARSPSAAAAATQFFTAALGFTKAATQLGSSNELAADVSTVVGANVAVHVVHTPAPERVSRASADSAARPLTVLGAMLQDPCLEAQARLSASWLPPPKPSASWLDRFQAMQAGTLSQQLHIPPRIHVGSASTTAASSSIHQTDAPVLQEVVLGCEAASVATAEHQLRAAGWQRHPRALAVWTSPCSSTNVRLIPSWHSCLVLHSENKLAKCAELQAASSHDLHAELYGVRAGVSSSGQVRVASASIPGLDVRFSDAVAPEPLFVESPTAFNDDVDEQSHPDLGAVNSMPGVSCKTAVDYELRSLLRRKWQQWTAW